MKLQSEYNLFMQEPTQKQTIQNNNVVQSLAFSFQAYMYQVHIIQTTTIICMLLTADLFIHKLEG